MQEHVEEEDGKEEESDTVAPLCTCGHQEGLSTSPTASSSSSSSSSSSLGKQSNQGSSSPSKNPSWLESSFVHLLAPNKPANSSVAIKHAHPCQQQGFYASHQHMLQLLDAASSPSSKVSLCPECIDRVAAAIEADTQRLYDETQAYREATTSSIQRNKTLQTLSPSVNITSTAQAYQDEIEMLSQEVQAQETELSNLNELYEEQLAITRQLAALEDQLLQEQYALELHARAFDDSIHLQTTELSKVQTEVDRLSLVKLPSALFDLQVDERGLRYPLINQLRLAYRPKGDVPSKEIQVAWSQATQLLLILGTLIEYPSSDWKLVPLTDCAKLIFRKEIYNLSPGDCRSLMAWNALLDQVVKHATSTRSTIPTMKRPPPFLSSSTSIDNTDLTRLNRTDDVGWSQVIHRMASNLLWLSDCASTRVAFKVGAVTHCVA